VGKDRSATQREAESLVEVDPQEETRTKAKTGVRVSKRLIIITAGLAVCSITLWWLLRPKEPLAAWEGFSIFGFPVGRQPEHGQGFAGGGYGGGGGSGW